jgi:RNA polymerase sigma-70 factor (ECF subfamily)
MSGAAGDLAGFISMRDEESFRRLYRRHTPKMVGLATRLLGGPDEVSDVLQEAWVRVVRDLDRFGGRSRFDTWVLGYVVRCCREVWRRRRRDRPAAADEDHCGETPAPADRLEAQHMLDLEHALRGLAPGYRSVLLLHDLYGFTHEEVAHALDIAVGTAKSQLARARRAMRLALEAAPSASRGHATTGGAR